jgi:hypothetical protein
MKNFDLPKGLKKVSSIFFYPRFPIYSKLNYICAPLLEAKVENGAVVY